jgi:ribosomal protein S6--L-glutamate ligase
MKIAILSRNKSLYSTQRLVEAAKQAGAEVDVLDHLKCDIVIEKADPSMFYHGVKLPQYDAVIPRIGASVTFYGTAVVRQFEMMNVFSTTSSQALVRSRNKLRSLQILSSAGVGLPKTVFTNYSKDVKNIIQGVGGAPLIIKLLEGTQGSGVVLAPTKSAAESMIEALHSVKERIIVQEFIEEAQGQDIRAFVVNGKVVGAMKRQGGEGEFRSNLHKGGEGKRVRLSKEERATALAASRAMGLSISGVDMLQSSRGPLVLEVNSSPGLEGIEQATGKDIAGSIVKFVMEKVHKPSGIKTVKRNKKNA